MGCKIIFLMDSKDSKKTGLNGQYFVFSLFIILFATSHYLTFLNITEFQATRSDVEYQPPTVTTTTLSENQAKTEKDSVVDDENVLKREKAVTTRVIAKDTADVEEKVEETYEKTFGTGNENSFKLPDNFAYYIIGLAFVIIVMDIIKVYVFEADAD